MYCVPIVAEPGFIIQFDTVQAPLKFSWKMICMNKFKFTNCGKC